MSDSQLEEQQMRSLSEIAEALQVVNTTQLPPITKTNSINCLHSTKEERRAESNLKNRSVLSSQKSGSRKLAVDAKPKSAEVRPSHVQTDYLKRINLEVKTE